jgi:hypothetical protein
MPASPLDDSVYAALGHLAGQGPVRSPVESRRIVFGLVVVAVARSRDRLGPEETLAGALARYRLATPTGDPIPAEAVLERVFASVAPAARACSAHQLIRAYERSLKWATGPSGGVALDGDAQHAAGAFFTPPAVAERLLDAGLDAALSEAEASGTHAVRGLRICDPACGAGVFLLAALRRTSVVLGRAASIPLAAAASEVLRRCIHGVDLDAAAVELCRALCWLETELRWEELSDLHGFRCGNSLLGCTPALAEGVGGPPLFEPEGGREAAWCEQFLGRAAGPLFHWHRAFPEVFHPARGPKNERTGAHGGFDAVIGNPPFLNQLEEASAHAGRTRELLRARFTGANAGYSDTAVAFTLLGVELLRAGGRCTLIAPLSILAARDAAPARERWAQSATLEAVWLATDPVFEGAAVFVCAPTLRPGGARRTTLTRRRDRAFTAVSAVEADMDALARAPTWSALVADILGIPVVRPVTSGVVAEEATVAADFRDEYYGLRGSVVESSAVEVEEAALFPPLVTTGSVDLARCSWGERPTRFDGRRWGAPRVNLVRLEQDARLGAWARSRLVPKVILATQTRVLEVVVDEHGEWLPCTPLISVVPTEGARAWHLAAALSSPPLTAFAAATYLGTALTVDSIKLSASQVRALPLPARGAAWDAAALLFRRAQSDPGRRTEHIVACGEQMCRAYGLCAADTTSVMAWWSPRALGDTKRRAG